MSRLLKYHPWSVALWRLTSADKIAEAVVRQIEDFNKLLTNRMDLKKFFEDPSIQSIAKAKALEEILGPGFKPPFSSFIRMIVEAGRAREMDEITDHFIKIVREETGRSRAKFISSEPMNAEEMEIIRKALTDFVGREVVIEASVDQSLIGGVQIYVEGKLIDGSVKGKLDRLRKQLLESEVRG